MVGWTFPGEESGGIEAAFVDRGGRTYLRVESVASDGSPRDFYATQVALVGPDLEPATAALSQVAPGVYEAPVASLQSGAYAVRVTQTKPGDQPLARTLGLVAPTPAEYRLLGANEALLAAIRSATGGDEVDAPAGVWVHDLRTTSRFTDVWPWLLVLALLLWPLDIALRRVSLGRRELADGRRWVADTVRGRRVAARTEAAESMLAARERAGAAGARTAILREAAERGGAGSRTASHEAAARDEALATARSHEAASLPSPVSTPAPPFGATPPMPPPPPMAPTPAPPSPVAPPPAPSRAAATPPPGAPDETLARLREAKRRTRS
jgi:hypothetical protein